MDGRRSSPIPGARSASRHSNAAVLGSPMCSVASGVETTSARFRASSGCRSPRSRKSSVAHPDGLPDLFLDRSLGRIKVPELLRQQGLRLVTLAERYGIPEDEGITDERWLRDAGRLGEVVLMKDGRVRYRPAERRAISSPGPDASAVTARPASRRDAGEVSRKPAPDDPCLSDAPRSCTRSTRGASN
jgi:hypothetical protein